MQDPQEEPIDPFSSLDFEEQIKPEHWKLASTKLTTPSFEATLTPDGRLLLKFSSVEILLDRGEVEALTRFLDGHAGVEPLAPPQEPEWFKNFKPTPVDDESGQP